MSKYRIQAEYRGASTDFVVYGWEADSLQANGAGELRRTRLAVFPTFELAQQAYPEATAALGEPAPT
jgi:hypothetical protein